MNSFKNTVKGIVNKPWVVSTLEAALIIVIASVILNTAWFLLYFAIFNKFYHYFNGLLRWFIAVAIVEVASIAWERWKVYDQYVSWYRRLKAAQSQQPANESGDKGKSGNI